MKTSHAQISVQSLGVLSCKGRTLLVLPAFLLCLMAMSRAQSVPNDILPEDTIAFRGTLVAAENYQDYARETQGDGATPPIIRLLFFVTGDGTANTTDLGQLTVIYTGMLDYTSGAGPLCARFIDASGDSIFTTCIGQVSETNNPSVKSMLEIHTVTGGTGKFALANGSFTMKRLLKFSADGRTGSSGGNFNGYLRLR